MDDLAPEPPARDWSLLPLDALSSIFIRLGAIDILMGAGLVCSSWLEAAKLPELWRAVDMENHEVVLWKDEAVLRAMAKAAVDRSGGQLRVFAGKLFVTDELMKYIVERSPSLTTLRLVSCCDVFSIRLVSVIRESPLLGLRVLELEDTYLCIQELNAVLESCPLLEVLRMHNCLDIYEDDQRALRAKFTGIKTMTVRCDSGFRYDPYHESDFFDYVPGVFDSDDEFRHGARFDNYDSDYDPDIEDLSIFWPL